MLKLLSSIRLSCLLLGLCSMISPTVYATTPADTLVMGFKIDDLSTLDPAALFEFTGLEYAANVYQRLVTLDPQSGVIQGDAASHWEISEDKKTYTFQLRSNLAFSTGRDLTAEDVVFSLKRAVKLQKTPSIYLKRLGLHPENVKENLKIIDPLKLSITFDKPYAPDFILYNLSLPVCSILDKKTLVQTMQKDSEGNSSWLQNHSLGSGPYQLVQWKPNQSITLKKNKYYHLSPVNLPRVLIRHMKEPATQRLLFNKGDLDIARNLTPDLLKNLEGKVQSVPKAWLWYLGLNNKHPILKKPEVQKAIRHLIDYDGIAHNLLKEQVRVHQDIIPVPYLGSTTHRFYRYNLEKARKLLESAGLSQGFEINIDTTNTELAQAIQHSLARAKIKVRILSGSSKQLLTKYRNREHEIFLGTWGSDYPDPHSCMTFVENEDDSSHSENKSIAWRNHWKNKLAHKVEAALLLPERDQRSNAYRAISKEVRRSSPIIVLFQKNELSAIGPHVEGFEPGLSSNTTLYARVKKRSE